MIPQCEANFDAVCYPIPRGAFLRRNVGVDCRAPSLTPSRARLYISVVREHRNGASEALA